MPATFWLNAQQAWDIRESERSHRELIYIQPLPAPEMRSSKVFWQ
jgi:plasmid maintenance system antidote protein VapI